MAEGAAATPAFTPVQDKLFAVAGSLANAWADIDGDGDPDLAVSTKHGEILLYRNDRGTFRSVGSEFGLPTTGDEIRGLSWGDFDGDGDPDLLAGSNVFPIPSRSYLFRHDNSRFTEVAAATGVALPGRFSRQANWIDFDGDGDLDLYAANRAGANRLLRNQSTPDGPKFDSVAFPFGTVDGRRTVGACWFDFDRDGDLDLFLANQSGDSDALWRNDGTRFVDVAPALGMDQTQRWTNEGGVGCAPGDYDNDGDPDLYVGTYGRNLLYRNESVDGRPRFVEVAQSTGLVEPHSVVGAAWGDADNDGDLDLFVASYERVNGVQEPRNALFINTDGVFSNVLAVDDAANAADHGVVWVDYDLDGDVDLSLTDGYGAIGGHPLLRNELDTAARRSGFHVRVRDAAGLATEAGAELRLMDTSGPRSGLRLVSTGGGYNAQSELDVHLVLPEECSECELEVRFPGMSGPIVARFAIPEDVLSGDRVLLVQRPASMAK
ncbi:MAG: VCBS repeat-containing protein [Pseudomonadota bacterium]